MAETARRCRNCNSELSGEYCAQCGQREGRAEQRFLDVAGELGGDFINLDSRLWRTLFGLSLVNEIVKNENLKISA